MYAPADSPFPRNTTEYLRRARKIRAEAAGNAAGIHQSLRNLADEMSPQDSSTAKSPLAGRVKRVDWSDSAVLGYRGPLTRDFADIVANNLVGSILPHTARIELLREAGRRGINRFEANLIIAAVQHHLGYHRSQTRRVRPIRLRKIPTRLLTFVAVQGMILAAVWYLVVN